MQSLLRIKLASNLSRFPLLTYRLSLVTVVAGTSRETIGSYETAFTTSARPSFCCSVQCQPSPPMLREAKPRLG